MWLELLHVHYKHQLLVLLTPNLAIIRLFVWWLVIERSDRRNNRRWYKRFEMECFRRSSNCTQHKYCMYYYSKLLHTQLFSAVEELSSLLIIHRLGFLLIFFLSWYSGYRTSILVNISRRYNYTCSQGLRV